MTRRLLLVLAVLSASAARAEIAAQDDHGFHLHQEHVLEASPDEAYDALVDIAAWWHPDHTYSADAANLSLDPVPGGLWTESLPGGGFVKHLEVVYADPGKALRLSGGLGPLADEGLAGSILIRLEPADAGTRLVFDYKVGGYVPAGAGSYAGPVDYVWNEALTRLGRYVATGSPDAE